MNALWIAILAVASAQDSGVSGRFGLRVPLADLADPLPYTGPTTPVGGARLDLLPGVLLHTEAGWQVGTSFRLSGYAIAFPDESIVPATRGALELDAVRFVEPHNERLDDGTWIGGYVGGAAALELWGRYSEPGGLGTLHFLCGYQGLIAGTTPGFLELGYGVYGDWREEALGYGAVVRAGLWLTRPLAQRSAEP